jgi:hypothetical protein
LFSKLPTTLKAELTIGLTNTYLFDVSDVGRRWMIFLRNSLLEVVEEEGTQTLGDHVALPYVCQYVGLYSIQTV